MAKSGRAKIIYQLNERLDQAGTALDEVKNAYVYILGITDPDICAIKLDQKTSSISPQYLLALDLDGTLIDNNQEFIHLEAFRSLINRAKKAEALIIIITARNIHSELEHKSNYQSLMSRLDVFKKLGIDYLFMTGGKAHSDIRRYKSLIKSSHNPVYIKKLNDKIDLKAAKLVQNKKEVLNWLLINTNIPNKNLVVVDDQAAMCEMVEKVFRSHSVQATAQGVHFSSVSHLFTPKKYENELSQQIKKLHLRLVKWVNRSPAVALDELEKIYQTVIKKLEEQEQKELSTILKALLDVFKQFDPPSKVNSSTKKLFNEVKKVFNELENWSSNYCKDDKDIYKVLSKISDLILRENEFEKDPNMYALWEDLQTEYGKCADLNNFKKELARSLDLSKLVSYLTNMVDVINQLNDEDKFIGREAFKINFKEQLLDPLSFLNNQVEQFDKECSLLLPNFSQDEAWQATWKNFLNEMKITFKKIKSQFDRLQTNLNKPKLLKSSLMQNSVFENKKEKTNIPYIPHLRCGIFL